jgi:hypothetical protein
MDPGAGMIRLVLGLGTRAVNRVENDYPRIVALDNPLFRTHGNIDDTRKFSQHEVDVLNVAENRFETVSLVRDLDSGFDLPMDLFGRRDHETTQWMRDLGMEKEEAWILTFDNLLSSTHFPETMRKILKTLETMYDYPVEIEFTANLTQQGDIKINLLQCRPLQTRGLAKWRFHAFPAKTRCSSERKVISWGEASGWGSNGSSTLTPRNIPPSPCRKNMT